MATLVQSGISTPSRVLDSRGRSAPVAWLPEPDPHRHPPRRRHPNPSATSLDPELFAFAADFDLPAAGADSLALTAANALEVVPQIVQTRIPPVRIGRCPAGPLVALPLERAREIPPDHLRILADGAPGRLILTREADLRRAVALRIGTIAPRRVLEAALRFAGRPAAGVAVREARAAGRTRGLTTSESEAMAAWLGLAFARSLAPCDASAFAGLVAAMPDRFCAVHGDDAPLLAVAPDLSQLADLAAAVCSRTAAACALVLTDPPTIRDTRRPRTAVTEPLNVRWDHGLPAALSARAILSPVQRTLVPPIILSTAAGAVAAPAAVPLAASLFIGLVLLGLAAVRAAASMAVVPDQPRPLHPLGDDALPTYSILVPLYREAASVGPLIASLRRLDYPRHRLDVIYLLESDDAETRAAFEAAALPPGHRVVVVPPEGPRTKPKALNVGLTLAAGDLVTIFDAEDRPERGQLRLAAETFAAGGERLACLQARLAIDHARDTWITRMFAIEYACLFDVLLPWLAARGLFFPLGGTSNHFNGLM